MKLHHLGIAVRSLPKAMEFFGNVLGLSLVGEEVVEPDGVRVASFALGEDRIELIEPLTPESPVGRFLDKRGDGLHHICLEIENLNRTLKALKEKGVPLVDEAPRRGAHGSLVAFLHPRGTGGVLIELAEKQKP